MANVQLTRVPSMKVGMLIRRPPEDVFQAIADAAITTKFWFTKSSGKMLPGADLAWEWEMYGVSSRVRVQEIERDRRIRFTWSGYDPQWPTTVEFRFLPWQDHATYIQITESGFTGDGDTLVQRVVDSTTGFTFVLSALKALLEHDCVLRLVMDAHPAGLEVR